jgi:hypothetical protein
MKEKALRSWGATECLVSLPSGKDEATANDDDAAASAEGLWAAFCVVANHLVDEPVKELTCLGLPGQAANINGGSGAKAGRLDPDNNGTAVGATVGRR